ncbi:helix-turn-helix transcriptional regulator [Roseiflexus castenholzii]|uniref:Transcriptional regulator-like protein n=1 Tax=Roseiflexus castenholzii (strain DSM 13941 / HLO8) TaxID=383372 RepID=A7NMJ2_ROSCS|nr:WYL domain-containing protein [Roseiflexus castenholzii]ABU58754.1 transcriptional regulator-like protein [Roseiflexus castenholzii DSM 13941]
MTEQRRRGGDKRSSLLIHRRRLFLIRRLIRGSATAEELINEANTTFTDVPEGIYPADASAALRRDIAALRVEYGCAIERDDDGVYTLKSPGSLALIDLPDHEIEAVAFLLDVYRESDLPIAAPIGTFLARIGALMPEDRQNRLNSLTASPKVERPYAPIEGVTEMMRALKGVLRKREVEFDYRSPHTPDGAALHHRVAPLEFVYREGHTYLDAFCLASDVPELVGQFVFYRLNRIVASSLRRLPQALRRDYRRPTYALRYRLAPAVARQRDVAKWFPETEIDYAADGSATVTAVTNDLWRAHQILMRYREHCRVIEPAPLIEMMRASIERMAALYLTDAVMQIHEDIR